MLGPFAIISDRLFHIFVTFILKNFLPNINAYLFFLAVYSYDLEFNLYALYQYDVIHCYHTSHGLVYMFLSPDYASS